MAFHGHLPHEMPMLPLGADDAAAAAAAAAGPAPAWMRYGGEGSFLHLQTTSDSSPSAAAVQWIGEEAVTTAGGGMVEEADAARCKADILAHPLYEQLLSAHVGCLRIATPVDQLPRIDAQLAQSQGVVAKYSGLAAGDDDGRELDQFMVRHTPPTFSISFSPHVSVAVWICLGMRRGDLV